MESKLKHLMRAKSDLDSIRVVFSSVQISNRDFIRIVDLGSAENEVMKEADRHNIKYSLARILGEVTLTIMLDDNKKDNVLSFLDDVLIGDKERYKLIKKYRKEYSEALESAMDELRMVERIVGSKSFSKDLSMLVTESQEKDKSPGAGCGQLRRKAMKYYEGERES